MKSKSNKSDQLVLWLSIFFVILILGSLFLAYEIEKREKNITTSTTTTTTIRTTTTLIPATTVKTTITTTTIETSCPNPFNPDLNRTCIQLVVYAKNPESGECCMYGSPCLAPAKWRLFYSEDECRGLVAPPPKITTTTTTTTIRQKIKTCDDYCKANRYKGGVCRLNPSQCTIYGVNEVYSPMGNRYCPRGSMDDTCCCVVK